MRPLTVRELIDSIAVDVDGVTGLNRKRRLQDADDIRYICPGLIDISPDSDEIGESVRITHFSVQEYLKSERIRDQKAAFFSLNSVEANAEIARICLIYLLDHDLSHSILDQVLVEQFPLAQFAAENWYHHYRNTTRPTPKLDNLILTLFQSRHAFTNSVKLYDMDSSQIRVLTFGRGSDEIASSVYYASLLGLDQILPVLINDKQEGDSTLSAQSIASTFSSINAQGGEYGNALQAASWRGHDKIVELLLEQGADVNAQGGYFGNALQAASWLGHKEIVQMLLDKGADINIEGGYYGNAIQAASLGGYLNVVRFLLEHGADVNIEGGCYGSALQAASVGDYPKTVQMLLEHGADINIEGGFHGSALQAASFKGHKEIVRILLGRGAHMNDQSGLYGNALQAALSAGNEAVVQMLLKHGAPIDLKDMQGRLPFHLTCAGGNVKSVKLVSSLTRDRTTQDRTTVDVQGRNGLHHAASRGSTKVVEWLLKEGFCPNEADRDGWTPLHWAAKNGNADTIAALKDAGARCTTERIEGWTPDLVAKYHHYQFPSSLYNDADDGYTTSKLASRESINYAAAKMGSRKKAICDGCDLVSLVSVIL